MITLTSSVAVPNIQRIELEYWAFDDRVSTAYLRFVVRSSAANGRAKSFSVIVRNGISDCLRINPNAAAWDDTVNVDAVSTPSGYDTLEAAATGASRSARKRSLEQAALSLGVIHAGLSGTVS